MGCPIQSHKIFTLFIFAEWGGHGSQRGTTGKPPLPRAKLDIPKTNSSPQDPLSQLFKDVGDGTVTMATMEFDEHGVWDPDKKASLQIVFGVLCQVLSLFHSRVKSSLFQSSVM